MFVRSITTVALLSLPFLTGCPMSHGDPDHPKKNPNPIKRYEVTATAAALGPWGTVKGRTFFDVVNTECTRENKFLGVHILPRDAAIDFEMTHIGENTWRGYFYRDAIQDENYYGLGICHWDATSVSAGFTAQGVAFSSGAVFEEFLRHEEQTKYFKKSDYGNRSLMGEGALAFLAEDSEVIQQPDAFFQITVKVREATP